MAKDNDSFDDLFKPFELDDGPPPPGSEPPPPAPAQERNQTTTPVEQIPCPSCGAFNPTYNRHCEQCGARLTKEPLPVAPAPMVRATPGGRALSVLAAAVLLVALIALVVNVFRGGGGDETTTTTTSTTSTTLADLVEITPTEATATAQISASFSAANLYDNDFSTEWQAPHGADLTLTFRFAQPVRLDHLEIFNISDETRFERNYRINGYKINMDDLPGIDIRNTLKDEPGGPQTIDLPSIGTTSLTIEILSTYASQAVNGEVAFDEIAVAEVKFYGNTVSN
ncbi:MAG: hypothetical protein WBV06_11160 [Acidimicrobiia bacterium]